MSTLNLHIDVRQQDATVLHVGGIPTDSPDLSSLVNVSHITRMLRASLRHQLRAIEAGYTVTAHLESERNGPCVEATFPVRHAHLVADLGAVLDTKAGWRTIVPSTTPQQ